MSQEEENFEEIKSKDRPKNKQEKSLCFKLVSAKGRRRERSVGIEPLRQTGCPRTWKNEKRRLKKKKIKERKEKNRNFNKPKLHEN